MLVSKTVALLNLAPLLNLRHANVRSAKDPFLFLAFPALGHNKPSCILAARLAKENRNFFPTLLLSPTLLDIAQADVAAEFGGNVSEDVRRRVRQDTVNITNRLFSQSVFIGSSPSPDIEPAYQNLVQARAIACAITSLTFDAVPSPAVVILDETDVTGCAKGTLRLGEFWMPPWWKEMRENAKRVQAALAQTWKTGGIGSREFCAFLEKFGVELSWAIF